jgi:hypothetical protein
MTESAADSRALAAEQPAVAGWKVAAVAVGLVLMSAVWPVAHPLLERAIADAIPTAVPLTNVPSIDCLLQYAHCLP